MTKSMKRGESVASQTALVTGSSSGIGQAIALALAQEGYHILAAMRSHEQADNLLAEASALGVGSHIEVMFLDLLQGSDAVEARVRAAILRVGHLDVLVNNAGTAEGGAIEEVPDRLWRRVMETNFFWRAGLHAGRDSRHAGAGCGVRGPSSTSPALAGGWRERATARIRPRSLP